MELLGTCQIGGFISTCAPPITMNMIKLVSLFFLFVFVLYLGSVFVVESSWKKIGYNVHLRKLRLNQDFTAKASGIHFPHYAYIN